MPGERDARWLQVKEIGAFLCVSETVRPQSITSGLKSRRIINFCERLSLQFWTSRCQDGSSPVIQRKAGGGGGCGWEGGAGGGGGR